MRVGNGSTSATIGLTALLALLASSSFSVTTALAEPTPTIPTTTTLFPNPSPINLEYLVDLPSIRVGRRQETSGGGGGAPSTPPPVTTPAPSPTNDPPRSSDPPTSPTPAPTNDPPTRTPTNPTGGGGSGQTTGGGGPSPTNGGDATTPAPSNTQVAPSPSHVLSTSKGADGKDVVVTSTIFRSAPVATNTNGAGNVDNDPATKEALEKKQKTITIGLSVAAAAIVLSGLGIFAFRKLGLRPSNKFRGRLGEDDAAGPGSGGASNHSDINTDYHTNSLASPMSQSSLGHASSPSPLPSNAAHMYPLAGAGIGAAAAAHNRHSLLAPSPHPSMGSAMGSGAGPMYAASPIDKRFYEDVDYHPSTSPLPSTTPAATHSQLSSYPSYSHMNPYPAGPYPSSSTSIAPSAATLAAPPAYATYNHNASSAHSPSSSYDYGHDSQQYDQYGAAIGGAASSGYHYGQPSYAQDIPDATPISPPPQPQGAYSAAYPNDSKISPR
ncbi:hypothetical protein DFS34DRAFT_651260 [Phlyctochytrium arcticum]|nr:hypothetical protein DFS34DRAFT_651260 [Phlyctochytrium arcticum]